MFIIISLWNIYERVQEKNAIYMKEFRKKKKEVIEVQIFLKQ